jgi:hypothetical protein
LTAIFFIILSKKTFWVNSGDDMDPCHPNRRKALSIDGNATREGGAEWGNHTAMCKFGEDDERFEVVWRDASSALQENQMAKLLVSGTSSVRSLVKWMLQ